MKKYLSILIFCIFLLCSCATVDHPCLTNALTKAEQIQDKGKLLFVEGNYKYPSFERHVQLWILKDGIYEKLTGGLIDKRKFRPTEYYSYDGYMERVRRCGWLE